MKKWILMAASCLFLTGTASADFCAPECTIGDFNLYADFLYWNPRRCNLDYALGTSSYLSLQTDYTPGFRVGAGYTTCSGLDLTVRYAEVNESVREETLRPSPDLYPTRLHPFTIALMEGLSQLTDIRYKIDYQVVDIELGSVNKEDCSGMTRYFLGAKLAYINEEIRGIYSTSPVILAPGSIELHEKLDLSAYGLSCGVEFKRDIYGRIGLYGRGALALLVGNYRKLHVENLIISNENLFDVSDCCTSFVGNAELAVGLFYDIGCICNFDLSLLAGYEFQGWMNTADFINFSSDSALGVQARNLGSFGVDGLFVRLQAGY